MQTCANCQQAFDYPEAFLALFEKLTPRIGGISYPIPLPSHCPACRYQRRLAHRNEWTMYRGRCAGSGKPIISIYSPNKPFTVYRQELWWSDTWEARAFARDFDFSRTFFEQFADLQLLVPRIAAVNTNSENSEYTNQCCENKDCYLCASSSYSDKCLYGYWNQSCRECIDSYGLDHCELCYECLNSANLYHCAYVGDSENCSNSWFSNDCRGCSYLLGCRGLRNKSYYWFNESISTALWQQKFNALRLTPALISELNSSSEDTHRSIPRKYFHGKMNENFSGDYIFNSRNTFHSFNCKDCWDVWYSQDSWRMKDSADITEVLDTERCFEIEGAIASFSAWITKSWPINNSYYCDLCFQVSDLFGCVGLRNAKFCILNKQYSENEYYALVPRIIAHMRDSGEWGEHFPIAISPFAYNETVAHDYFPLSRQNVLQRGWNWQDEVETAASKGTPVPAIIPEYIADVSDELTKQVLMCESSGQPYKVIAQELNFYRKLQLPIPRRAPIQRRIDRLRLRNPRKLWPRQCMNTKVDHAKVDDCGRCLNRFESSYSPDRSELVFCEECYLQEIS